MTEGRSLTRVQNFESRRKLTETRYIGVTRFSVVKAKNSGFRIDDRDREAYLNELFDWDRLADRMFIFENVSAPILGHFGENYDFTHLVQYSPELPVTWKRRLYEIAERYPCIHPVEVVDEDIAETVHKFVLTWERDFIGKFVWFRVDDDDILSVDYLDAVDRYVSDATIGYALSFGLVYSGIFSNGHFFDFHRARSPYNSQGQAYICHANLPMRQIQSPGMVPHHQPNHYMPVIVSDLEPYAFWTRHPLQDSILSTSSAGAKVANLQADLGKHGFADFPEVLRKFPGIGTLARSGEVDIQNQVRVNLPAGKWVQVPTWLQLAGLSTVIRIDYAIDFKDTPNSSATLWFDFEDKDSIAGSFPRDSVRGDYRRMFCDRFGHGTILVMLENGDLPNRLRFESDNKSANSASIIIEAVEDIRDYRK